MENDRDIRWSFVPIEKKYQRDTFDCGYPILNDYLKKYARQNHEKGIAKTFVAISESGSLKIDGYYTVSASVIEYESLPESEQRGMPTYPIPAMLIGKLAVDNPAKGQGLGGELLADALYRAIRASAEIGIYAVRVDAIDLQAKELYLKYEFIPFQDRERSLFLPMEAIIRDFS
ncbi:MAG: GNAT family N-acetyltransferase [Cyanomargarita calcarea GSE-NOS-MK-12-04C]|jgi:GNAT superfamily N-acetyltransferase|uniref:GNAT family N-acetyltransferase n=1 Tax=Cyanomargarita calcarea GSE-NOS-MK-12-04C TaxID=2839659 RepID=A0A951QRM0_9CYAN|nr:GNAT family N-acetyltransferase [Cyanomargarita calcarea GSE-NOS-MK-12-04C]